MIDLNENTMDIEEDTQKDRYLTFSIENESYGVEIKHVTEIVDMQKITKIPELPDYIKGIINFRGTIIPVMDVRLRFRKKPKDYDDRTCIIVIDIGDMSAGLIVDTVSEVITIPEQDIVAPPKMDKDCDNECIKKIGKVGEEVKLLLDCEKLLTADESGNPADVK